MTTHQTPTDTAADLGEAAMDNDPLIVAAELRDWCVDAEDVARTLCWLRTVAAALEAATK